MQCQWCGVMWVGGGGQLEVVVVCMGQGFVVFLGNEVGGFVQYYQWYVMDYYIEEVVDQQVQQCGYVGECSVVGEGQGIQERYCWV